MRYWTLEHVDEQFITKTPAGFDAAYRIKGCVQRIDDSGFNAARGEDGGPIDMLVRAWRRDVLMPLMEDWFFCHAFTNIKIPECGHACTACYRVVGKGKNRRKVVFDANCCELRDAANATEWVKNGCKIHVYVIEKAYPPEMIERNFKMLTPDVIEQMEGHELYSVAVEVASVMAMKHGLDLDRALAAKAGKPFDEDAARRDRERILELERENRELRQRQSELGRSRVTRILNAVTIHQEIKLALIEREKQLSADIDRKSYLTEEEKQELKDDIKNFIAQAVEEIK
jgi:hypothetical protein